MMNKENKNMLKIPVIILSILVILIYIIKAFEAMPHKETIEIETSSVEETEGETDVIVIKTESKNDDIVKVSHIEETVEETEAVESYDEAVYVGLLKGLTGECQTMSYDNQILYGSVMLNRMAANDYPDTIEGVLADRKFGMQYSSWYDGNCFRDPTEVSEAVAKFLAINGSQIPENVIFQSEFPQGSGVWKKVGNTYFCYR